MTDTWTITARERQSIVRQIGFWNVAAISGGRVFALSDGIQMPCGAGYVVRVHLTPADDYTVERVFIRKGKEYQHGSRDRSLCRSGRRTCLPGELLPVLRR